MNRIEALTKARELFGDLGMISSDERKPHLVWMIGETGATMSRGKTWDEAVAKATVKAARFVMRKQEVTS